jgi:hypothetical protein
MDSRVVAAVRGLACRSHRLLAAVAAVVVVSPVQAGEPWLAPGNMQARHDIELLVDSGVIDLPISGWPIAVSDLAHALETPASRPTGEGRREDGDVAKENGHPLTAAQQAAVARLRHIASEGHAELGFDLAGAARPTVLRTFEDTPREEGELSVHAASFVGSRFGGRLELTGVVDPDDDKTVRLDGSYVAGKFGNWIVTLGAQARWWGSGWDGSLILSSNARPVPAIALDRAVSKPFESKWLSWIGPWRLTTFMGRMEGGRQDYDHPLLFGMRISARPLNGLEISVDRTAQWCGEGRSCTWNDFKNVFAGNDNAGENVSAQDEPGNQLAGWDIRWASPVGSQNYALYWEHTGESIDNHIPRPYRAFDLVGVEIWGGSSSDGSSWRAGFETAGTRCGGTENGQKLWDCAYNNAIFNPDGYRYYGRPLGHAMDGDGTMNSLRYVRVDAQGATLTALARYTVVNGGGTVPDTRHSIAPGQENWISLDVTYRRNLGAGWIEGGVGVDQRRREWSDNDAALSRAWLSLNWPWR